jgi:hypothetical protein
VSVIEELLERKSSGSSLENREYSRRDQLRWPRDTLYPQNLVLTSATSGGCSVSIVRSEIQATELSFGPPVWSSGQSSWLQIQRSGFDSQPYQIFWEVVGLERGPLSLVSTTEELLDRKVAPPV